MTTKKHKSPNDVFMPHVSVPLNKISTPLCGYVNNYKKVLSKSLRKTTDAFSFINIKYFRITVLI